MAKNRFGACVEGAACSPSSLFPISQEFALRNSLFPISQEVAQLKVENAHALETKKQLAEQMIAVGSQLEGMSQVSRGWK